MSKSLLKVQTCDLGITFCHKSSLVPRHHPVPRPKQNVVGTKWVFRNKQDEHGVVTRNKARLVAKGYAQVAGSRL